jgi:hypothetical protein
VLDEILDDLEVSFLAGDIQRGGVLHGDGIDIGTGTDEKTNDSVVTLLARCSWKRTGILINIPS